MKEIILEKLKDIEKKENVKIIYAVESGSRAWGFASADSDYDVRFIYVRTLEDYLALNTKKDTIEYELNDVFDINGWDLRKALQLLYKSNPTLYEWYASPIVYIMRDEWKMMNHAFENYFQAQKALHHYYHMSFQEFHNSQTLKHKLYCLRTLLSCLYIITYQVAPPIEIKELLFLLPSHLKTIVLNMIEIKQNQSEFFEFQGNEILDQYIQEQLQFIKLHLAHYHNHLKDDLLNQTFISIIKALSK